MGYRRIVRRGVLGFVAWLVVLLGIAGGASAARYQGWVCGLECVEMELGEPDASGRRRPIEKKGGEGYIVVESEKTGRTTKKGVF